MAGRNPACLPAGHGHTMNKSAIQDANPILRAGRLLPPLLAQRA